MSGAATVPGRGRKPKPTARKQLAGNPGKRKLNKNEPQYSPVLAGVTAPDWISEDAKTMWDLVTAELCREGILTVTDLHNVEGFCCAYSNWRMAQKELDQMGVTVITPTGSLIKNPAATVVNETLRQMVSLGSLLGLDPSSRSRLMGANKKPAANEFSEF